jgi:hypothetical protein
MVKPSIYAVSDMLVSQFKFVGRTQAKTQTAAEIQRLGPGVRLSQSSGRTAQDPDRRITGKHGKAYAKPSLAKATRNKFIMPSHDASARHDAAGPPPGGGVTRTAGETASLT